VLDIVTHQLQNYFLVLDEKTAGTANACEDICRQLHQEFNALFILRDLGKLSHHNALALGFDGFILEFNGILQELTAVVWVQHALINEFFYFLDQ
jgi:hypothetical protein